MSANWWKAAGIFALAMIALSFISIDAAISVTLLVAFSAFLLRLKVGANNGH